MKGEEGRIGFNLRLIGFNWFRFFKSLFCKVVKFLWKGVVKSRLNGYFFGFYRRDFCI